ncbi:hypothetical protein F0P96_18650 [Hymenobacter busanensis]|uniref:Peptidase C14 caspase domain-containing protein n=1 Tax=Hymenobacter busanensis TaxID=2607656 RepID=A0A7L4ZSM4_9BACT|nr:caspase family protein [Hymenobacter busanensis]KAA9327252.1 hypothetical protein F0P96_18650 [Hymenobacter busanensis]QHJ05917.1 hypothetical protein GUY19_00855 [Hymenobacter busanensis]
MKRNTWLLLLLTAFVLAAGSPYPKKVATSVSVLCIGNQHYPNTTEFETVVGVNQSAKSVLTCFASIATPTLLLSTSQKPLSKERILKAIKAFIASVERQQGEANVGVIYYCGHGIASQAGSRYFVPGDIQAMPLDATYEMLTQRLINIDTIKYLIIDAQRSPSRSRYVLLADCCSLQDFSKWYKGIKYHYKMNPSGFGLDGVVEYDSAAIRNMMNRPSVLGNSAKATFSPQQDTSKAATESFGTSEIPDMGELIREMTFSSLGNQIYYSSAMNKSADMVAHPYPTGPYQQVAPICRRTLLYFNAKKPRASTIRDYFMSLTEPQFDKLTQPVLLNPSRNEGDVPVIGK